MATRYITGASNAAVKAVAKAYDIGLLLTPDTASLRRTTTRFGPAGTLGGYRPAKHSGPFTTLSFDNGAFSGKRAYDPETVFWPFFTAAIDELTAEERARTSFFAVPDKLDWLPKLTKDGKPVLDRKGEPELFCVGDVETTIAWAAHWLPRMKAYATAKGWNNCPFAFVAQDGIEDRLDEVPWDDIDVVFLGGSDHFKLGFGGELTTKEAHRRGKTVHMGRVNSGRRMKLADSWGIETADGTYLKAGPDINLPHLMEWLDELNDRDPLPCYGLVKARGDKAEAKARKARETKKARSAAATKAAATRKANKAGAARASGTTTTTRKAA